MTIQDIIATFQSHNWLALALLVALYLRTLFGPNSKLPVTLSPNWRTVFVSAFGALVIGLTARSGGASVGMSVVAAVAGAVAGHLGEALLIAFFGSPANAPTIAKVVVFLVDDVFGGGGNGGGQAGTGGGKVVAGPGAPKPPAAARMALVGAAVMLAGCAAFWGSVAPGLDCGSKVAEDAKQGMGVVQIVADLPSECGMDLAQVIALLAASKDPAVQHSKAHTEALRARAELLSMPEPKAGN